LFTKTLVKEKDYDWRDHNENGAPVVGNPHIMLGVKRRPG